MKNFDLDKKIIDSILNETKSTSLNGFEKSQVQLQDQYQTIWEESRNLTFPDFDPEKARMRIELRIINADEKRKRVRFSWIRVASLLAVGIISWFLLKTVLNDKNGNEIVEIYVQHGERLKISLPDGNKVWLNSNTTLRYPANFTGFNKRMEVQGEAYFDLKNKGNYPLMISAGSTMINCTGAIFNIKTTHNNTDVIVESGAVTLSNTQIPNSLEIIAGEKASVSGEIAFSVEPGYSPNELAWKTGEMIFQNTPLKTVALVISSYFNVNVKVEGDLKYCGFTSSYKNMELPDIINDIERNYKLQISRNGGEIFITGHDCN
jgi:ferric-dicitrate binding protein FerR (iron transport regulator)